METVFDKNNALWAHRLRPFPEERLKALLFLCDEAQGLTGLERDAQRIHRLFFHSDTDPSEAERLWMRDPAFAGVRRAGWAALVMLSGMHHMAEVYSARGIPEERMAESLSDLGLWMDEYAARTGLVGLEEVGWLIHTMRGILFRLGRFQYLHTAYRGKACAYERLSDGLPVAFFHEAEELRPDGLVNGTNGIWKEGWQSRFHTTETEIAGTPIHPKGHGLPMELRLQRDQWEQVFGPDDGMLELHIPRDGKMEPLQCKDSILDAIAFFRRHFPDKPFRLLHLHTWFLDGQFEALLPAESNIVRLGREFYRYPVADDERQTYKRVFGSDTVDIATAPEDTALRRAIKGHVLAGYRMQGSAGFLLPRSIDRFGTGWLKETAAFLERNGKH